MAEFRFLRASEWGMTWARPPVAEKPLDPEVFVHHTAGAHNDDAVAAFRALNAYAQKLKPAGKGYSALDYDILVHRSKATGVVTIGGGREGWMSAATADRNEQGEAVCVLGYFHPGSTLTREPHPDEIEGVALGIVWGIGHGWISPDAVILGHRDNPAHPGATGCPGDHLYKHLPTIRARVAELLNPTPGDDDVIEGIDVRIDTRETGAPYRANEQRTIVAGPLLPPGTKGVFVNAVALNSTADGYLTAFTSGVRPNKSFVNYKAGQVGNGFTFVELSGFGTFELFNSGGGDVVLDFAGAVI